MDKNTVAGIFLIAIILIGYSLLTSKDKEELEELRRKRDSLEQIQARAASEQKNINDSIQKTATVRDTEEIAEDAIAQDKATKDDLQNKFGVFAEAGKGKPGKYIMENNLIRAEITNKGGRIYSVELKNYQTYDSSKLVLFDGDSNRFGLNFFAQNRSISTNDLYFKPVERQDKHLKAADTPQELKLRLYADKNKYIEYTYIIKPDSYMLDFDIRFVNMDGIIAQNINNIDINWEMYAPSLEKGKENENYYTTIY
ncbi:MAG: YidC/Oxa1 family insertase periplasmic-domain containing protein, partial [Bacteroidota bacterium]